MSIDSIDDAFTLREAYEHGYSTCEHDFNVAAFGAIRRAIIVARQYERESVVKLPGGGELHSVSGSLAVEYTRAAIRAAIGSDKT